MAAGHSQNAAMAAVHVCDVDELFRLYTLPPAELCKHHLIVDVRSAKAFSRGHLALAFCCRVASSTRVRGWGLVLGSGAAPCTPACARCRPHMHRGPPCVPPAGSRVALDGSSAT